MTVLSRVRMVVAIAVIGAIAVLVAPWRWGDEPPGAPGYHQHDRDFHIHVEWSPAYRDSPILILIDEVGTNKKKSPYDDDVTAPVGSQVKVEAYQSQTGILKCLISKGNSGVPAGPKAQDQRNIAGTVTCVTVVTP